jgi:hypothetical protein
MITFTEEDLVRGITNGSLYSGVFDEYRCRPHYVSSWPARFQRLKMGYGKNDIGTNEEWP